MNHSLSISVPSLFLLPLPHPHCPPSVVQFRNWPPLPNRDSFFCSLFLLLSFPLFSTPSLFFLPSSSSPTSMLTTYWPPLPVSRFYIYQLLSSFLLFFFSSATSLSHSMKQRCPASHILRHNSTYFRSRFDSSLPLFITRQELLSKNISNRLQVYTPPFGIAQSKPSKDYPGTRQPNLLKVYGLKNRLRKPWISIFLHMLGVPKKKRFHKSKGKMSKKMKMT